jgi:hypothetical protein
VERHLAVQTVNQFLTTAAILNTQELEDCIVQFPAVCPLQFKRQAKRELGRLADFIGGVAVHESLFD